MDSIFLQALAGGLLIGAAASLLLLGSGQIAGISDFGGDGRSDILWRHADGSVATWQMDGAVTVHHPGEHLAILYTDKLMDVLVDFVTAPGATDALPGVVDHLESTGIADPEGLHLPGHLPPEFFTGPGMLALADLLLRAGMRSDDPTIFSWELANEPRCKGTGPASTGCSCGCGPTCTNRCAARRRNG